MLKKVDTMDAGSNVWVKRDKPVELRVLYSLTYGTKYNLSYYYQKGILWANVDEKRAEGELWIGDDKVFAASIKDGQVSISHEESWEEWMKSSDFPEFAQTLEKVQTTMAAAAKGAGKSGEKGAKGGSKAKGKGTK